MPFEAIDRFERVRHRNRYCIPSVATALQIIAILILVLTIALSSWSAPQKWQKQQHVSRIEAISANDLASISDVSKVAVPLEPERAVSQQNSTYPILSTLHRYRRRAVSEEDWGKKVKRGTDLDCAFGMPLSAVAQSPGLRWSSLAEWGWEDESHKSMYIEMEMEGISDLAPTLDAFHRYHNYDTAFLTGKWQDSNMGHGKEYIWPGTDRHEHPTTAQYSAWLNTQYPDRILWLRQSSYSPAYEMQNAKNSFAGEKAPDLQRWSDISALQYFHMMGGSEDGSGTVKAPRLMVIPQIARGPGMTDTLDTIDKAHEMLGKTLSDWPGVVFDDTNRDVFVGVLGTAHGSGPGFFLAQHKAWFGNMKIESIQVWVVQMGSPIYNMAFSIVPVTG